jgi:hypothetical protein
VTKLSCSAMAGCAIVLALVVTREALAQGGHWESPGNGCSPMSTPIGIVNFYEKVRNSVRTSIIPPQSLTITGRVAPKSTPQDVSIAQSSGDAQFDADCLVAVICCDRDDDGNMPIVGDWTFFDVKRNQKYALTPQKGAVKILIIPAIISQRYPGTFGESELFNKSNELTILKSERDTGLTSLSHAQVRRICDYMNDWNSFFRQNPGATKSQILLKAQKLNSDTEGE